MKTYIDTHFETSRCLLCHDAPCSAACPKEGIDPARGIRALRFENDHCAGLFFNSDTCSDCDAPCQKACIHYDFPIRISGIAKTIGPSPSLAEAMAGKRLPSLEMDFCGIRCENPFFLGSSVVASSYEMIASAFRAGWGGVVYKTVCFDEIKEVSPRFDQIGKETASCIGFRNMEQLSVNTPEEDFNIMARLKKEFPGKVVTASIMGSTDEEWEQLAQMAQDAGCDMIECNFSCPHMSAKGRGSDVGQSPRLVGHYSQIVRNAVSIPVMAKMTPNVTHIEEPAIAAVNGGADAVSAINTIKSITLKRRSEVDGKGIISGYSGKAVKPIAQRFILDMRKNRHLKDIPISGIGGIESWRDALQYIMLGCNNVQVVTAVMQYGCRIIDDIVLGIQDWMLRKGYGSLEEARGIALERFVGTDMLDRDTRVLPVFDREKCTGCGRCYISCSDGGHQAISFDSAARQPHLLGRRCVGCHLCLLVCPAGAIHAGKRIPALPVGAPGEI